VVVSEFICTPFFRLYVGLQRINVFFKRLYSCNNASNKVQLYEIPIDNFTCFGLAAIFVM